MTRQKRLDVLCEAVTEAANRPKGPEWAGDYRAALTALGAYVYENKTLSVMCPACAVLLLPEQVKTEPKRCKPLLDPNAGVLYREEESRRCAPAREGFSCHRHDGDLPGRRCDDLPGRGGDMPLYDGEYSMCVEKRGLRPGKWELR